MSYMGGQGFFSNNKRNQVWLHTPGGSSRNFWLYSYTRTTRESQVLSSAPGKITAGELKGELKGPCSIFSAQAYHGDYGK
ncbi:MAG: hypothetical protein IPO00_03450 [Betaproteobacteria bacterium]|jgi:hypothetical protein|nr:hypothetical protein [Betaproteobacteria bacterium]